MDARQLYAIKARCRERIRKVAPEMNDWSGIYVWYRRDPDDNNIYFYAGQSVHLVQRSVAHIMQYDHLGLSIKKRGLYAEGAQHGWKFMYYYCDRSQLDEQERKVIADWLNNGAIAYNITGGGQNAGKVDINDRKPARGYMDGLKQGYKKARVEIAKLFNKNLLVSINGKPTVNKQKALDKFNAFIAVNEERTDNE